MRSTLKGTIRLICQECFVVALSVLLGALLLILSYALPTEVIKENVTRSVPVFQNEGVYPQVIYGNQDSQLDNWTDALMLQIAAEHDPTNIVRSAMLNTFPSITDLDPVESLIAIYNNQLEPEQTVSKADYGRYWHGYLIFLKPLLYIFDYQTIRYLIMFVQILLLAVIFVLLGRRNHGLLAFPLILMYLFCNPLVIMQSLQFSTAMTLVLLQIICFLLNEKEYLASSLYTITHFVIFGCLTSYFDLLTYPLVSLGVPLAYFICISGPAQKFKSAFTKCVQNTLAWGCGYIFMWAGKWVVGTLLTGQNIISNALTQAAYRTSYSNPDEVFSYQDVVTSILRIPNSALVRLPIYVALIFVLLAIFRGLRQKRVAHFFVSVRMVAGTLVCVLLIAAAPFLWFAVFAEHSIWHAWFTYRELSITVYCICACAAVLCSSTVYTPKK